MNNSPRTRWAAKGLLIASFLVVIFAGAMAFKAKKAVYDPAESEAKLRKIGAALQLYRAEYGFKPVAERNNYSDAGLPESFGILVTPGHPWTLKWEDLQISDPRNIGTLVKIHFSRMYWKESHYARLGDLAPLFKARGEKFPVLHDPNYQAFNPQERTNRVMVLRLDGTVEVVSYEKSAPFLELWSK